MVENCIRLVINKMPKYIWSAAAQLYECIVGSPSCFDLTLVFTTKLDLKQGLIFIKDILYYGQVLLLLD